MQSHTSMFALLRGAELVEKDDFIPINRYGSPRLNFGADPAQKSFGSALMSSVTKQFSSFVVIGLIVTGVHYGLLIGLVETDLMDEVSATLTGYLVGGVLSYRLNRRYAFHSSRPHAEATWRFAAVAGVGFVVTGVTMHCLHEVLGFHYLLVQLVCTTLVMVWSFTANRLWTFGGAVDP